MPHQAAKRRPRKRKFARNQLSDLSLQLRQVAASIDAASQRMGDCKLSSVEIDGAQFPVRGVALIRAFLVKVNAEVGRSEIQHAT